MSTEDTETDAVQFLRSRLPAMLRGKEGGYDLDRICGVDLVGDISKAFALRHEFILRYGFAILDRDTVTLLYNFGPLLEVGAGTGYWAHELRQAGIDIIATDIEPGTKNDYGFVQFWGEVETLDGVSAVRKYPDRTLLLVWPDYLKHWSVEALQAYQGNRVIYVGEGDGGCTGCDAFHNHLGEHYERVHSAALYQFSGIHDGLEIWERP